MPYTLRLEPYPKKELERLNAKHPDVVKQVLDALELLAGDPVRRSSPADYPLPLGQKFEFRAKAGAVTFQFTSVFRYHELNNEIWLRAIGWVIE